MIWIGTAGIEAWRAIRRFFCSHQGTETQWVEDGTMIHGHRTCLDCGQSWNFTRPSKGADRQ